MAFPEMIFFLLHKNKTCCCLFFFASTRPLHFIFRCHFNLKCWDVSITLVSYSVSNHIQLLRKKTNTLSFICTFFLLKRFFFFYSFYDFWLLTLLLLQPFYNQQTNKGRLSSPWSGPHILAVQDNTDNDNQENKIKLKGYDTSFML